jgi:hypothetical protein
VGQECPRELADMSAVHAFYRQLLETHLGHPIPLPAEVKPTPDSKTDSGGPAETLKFWLDLLDMAITPPMVREALKRTEGADTAHALLRYFVTKASPRFSDRDKADCVITHLFRTPCPSSPNQWQRPETDSSYYHVSQAALMFEAELYRALGDVQFESIAPNHVQLLREFEYFHQELEEFRHFDQITDSAIVQRVRELKQSLGKSFYHPDSLANIAAWNDVFGRRFDELFHDATKQIKTFAENVKREGGSIMSRVEGDITVKQLTEIETQQILAEDYQNAQDQFRKVSQYKKAVDHKRSARPGFAAGPARPIAMPAPQTVPGTPGAAPVGAPTTAVAQPMAAPAQPKIQGKQEAEVLAVPPSPAIQNAVQEGKLHSTKATIREYVRTADAKLAHIVPVKRSKIMLSSAEAEAFRADYQGEKSFRADFANILMLLVSYHARMLIEVDEYNQKSGSAYLWKPHADALGYLLNTLERLSLEAEQIKTLAQQRGLQDKANAVDATLDKVKKYANTVSQTLQAADQSFSS